jgi:hypothetical protein
MYTLCLMTKGNDDGYMRHQSAKNQRLTNSPNFIFKKFNSYQFDGRITMDF